MPSIIHDGPIDVDVDQRMAQVVGNAPRIAPIPTEELSPAQIATIDMIRASISGAAGQAIPEFFRTIVKHPALFRAQLEAGTMYFTGTIPPRERELAILRIAWLCRAPYEWGEHVEIAKRYGLAPDDVERVTQGSTAPGWTDHDRAILSGVEELLGDHALSDRTWERLEASWSEAQLLEFPMLVGAYISTALQQNSIRMQLSRNNPGLTHR